jgi:hypothetical protein
MFANCLLSHSFLTRSSTWLKILKHQIGSRGNYSLGRNNWQSLAQELMRRIDSQKIKTAFWGKKGHLKKSCKKHAKKEDVIIICQIFSSFAL